VSRPGLASAARRLFATVRRTRHGRRKQLLMLLLGGLVGLEFLESGMFVFAASHIVGGVDAGPREFAQVQAAYAVGSMLMIVMQQSLARHFGYRRYLCGALALFMAGAIASSTAQSVGALALARTVQGFGGGALFTSARVLVNMLFPGAERPRAMKYFMLTLFGLNAAGPIAAAALVDGPGWPWIFVSVVPLTALLMVACWRLLPDAVGRGTEPVRWDAVPLLLAAAALTLLQVALSQARYDLFSHPLQLALVAAAGAVLLLGFLWQQWHHHAPLLRLRELAQPVYLVGLCLYFLHYLLSNATNYLFPIYAEQSLGLPVIAAGWLNTFSATVSFAGACLYVRFARLLPSKKPLMITGALCAAFAAGMLALIPPDAPAVALLLPLVAKGLFGVLLILPVAGLTFSALGDEHFAHGYQSKNLMRQIAGSFATAIAAITLQDRQFANASRLTGVAGPDRSPATDWLDGVQSAFAAQGMSPASAHSAAMAALDRVINQQSLLLACEDLYKLITVVALVTAAILLGQRTLR